MRPLRSLLAVAIVCAASLSATEGSASSPVRLYDVQAGIDRLDPVEISCGQGVRTTQNCAQPDTQIEPSIAVNPNDPLNAVAVFQEGRRDSGGAVDNGYATTFDGGATWTYGDLPGLTTWVGGSWDRASDAVVAFGPNNVVYANSLVFNTEQDGAAGLTVNVSHDGGRTWGAPVLVHTDATGRDDKNWIVVDNGTGLGHHPGRVYVVWDQIAPVLAAYSDDEGRTWQSNGGTGYVVFGGQGIGAMPLVLEDGSLGVVFETLVTPVPRFSDEPMGENEPLIGITKLVFCSAPGAGLVPTGAPLVFGGPVTIATDDARSVRHQRAGQDIPAASVDPVSGKIYVAWSSGRFRHDDVNDIALTSSSTLGATWSVATRVNPLGSSGSQGLQTDHWGAAVGVGSDGAVHVAYRQREEHHFLWPDDSTFSSQVDTFHQRSLDGGKTFSDPLQLNSVQNNMYFGAVSRGGVFLGDYDQLAVGADPENGDRVYVVRAEPMRTSLSEEEAFTPIYHHQRTWVAVVR